MNWRKGAIFSVVLSTAAVAGDTSRGAQTFQNYLCSDGTQFIAAFAYGSRANLQLDGKAVTLSRRPTLTGSRYSGSGVTLRITRAGHTTLKRTKRPETACEQI